MIDPYIYKVKVVRVVDADTVDLIVDMGFGQYWGNEEHPIRFRIYNYDAPETWRPKCEAEKIHGEAATNRAKELLESKEIYMKSVKKNKPDIYGRFNAALLLSDGTDYVTLMKSEGFEKLESYNDNSM